MSENNTICNQCGKPRRDHEIDERTGEPTKCPVTREETNTPPQEHHRTPRGDY
jgi:hypothetical protein